MSDASPDPPKRRSKLPPLTGEEGTESEQKKKVVKRKKKKPTEDPSNGHTPKETDETQTPRKKRVVKKKEQDGETPTKTTPRKRKKKTEGDGKTEGDPTSARSAGSQGEDVTGSKASLISKEPKGTGTPKKKVRKKKKAGSTPSTARDDDEFADTLVAELSAIQEDVVVPEEKKDFDVEPYSTESAALKSQAVDKLFIETDSGFKGENKTRFAKKWKEEEAIRELEPEGPKNTTIEFAISMHKIFITIGLFIHGVTAGIAIWHITMTYILLYFDEIDFIEHYRPLALPVQCMFYILLVLCTVSASDRFDIGNPTRRFILQSITLQTGTISVLIYVASMVCSLAIANLEDKMNLYNTYRNLWVDEQGVKISSADSDIQTWTNLNTARCSLAILAWIVLSITSATDRFGENLKKGDDNILGEDVELTSQKPIV